MPPLELELPEVALGAGLGEGPDVASAAFGFLAFMRKSSTWNGVGSRLRDFPPRQLFI